MIVDEEALAECFRTEEELDARVTELTPGRAGTSGAALLSTCSTGLKLYDGTSYGLPMLEILVRMQWIDLAAYGFNNKTSSFKIGACSSYFADLAWGGGDWYPTAQTTAWKQSPSMISGWNNRVSSVHQN